MYRFLTEATFDNCGDFSMFSRKDSLAKEINRKIPLSLSYLKGKFNINQMSMFMEGRSSSSERKKKSLSLLKISISLEDKDLMSEVVTAC